ncbi:MAG: acetyl-CoA carboxylase biotin carboxyl carrier protein [Rhodospirillaceae bacterium]|nr:acetyl-CoA carboxylase biotin carboxyl carrier protein [Rhodospirillaceae bacterium]
MIEFDPDLIRQLAGLLDETNLSEIEITDGEQRVRVARQLSGVATVMAPQVAHDGTRPAAAAPEAPERIGDPVTAPMVGTVYLAPEPGATPFVRAGDRVVEGQTVLIVEAMKVMNPIRAPRAGVVHDIMVTDGQPVEYGEVLLTLE